MPIRQPITENWLRDRGFLPGDERPVEMAKKIWSRGETEDNGKEPAMHLVWSSDDGAWWIEAYDADGRTLAAVELPPKTTRGQVTELLNALGINEE
jgi:hypothetical protein